jgi:subtilisin family serine protease
MLLLASVTPSTSKQVCFLTAGTIGSSTYGVAKAVKLVGVKVLSDEGSGSNSGVISGIEWVLEQALNAPDLPRVCNLSLGGFRSKALDTAVTSLVIDGKIFTAVAAGNDNKNACRSSPAKAQGVMSVGATDDTDQRSSFSNFGPCVDIFGEFSFLAANSLVHPKSSPWFVISLRIAVRSMSCFVKHR